MPAHTRVNWEFYAVIKGKLAPVLGAKERPALVARSLWLFPPGFSHGWRGAPGKRCEVVVFHYSLVPPVLESSVDERGFLVTRLSHQEVRRVAHFAKILKRHYWNPVGVSEIYSERILLDLSLILLKRCKGSRQPNQTGVNLRKVLAAEGWLKVHVAGNPSVQDAAEAAGISASQLRRLFRKVRKASPKQVLNKLRFDAAMQLMAESDAKLQSVAASTGFSSASNFCRAFKHHVGKPPSAWRREIYIQYQRPSAANRNQYYRHGRRKREL